MSIFRIARVITWLATAGAFFLHLFLMVDNMRIIISELSILAVVLLAIPLLAIFFSPLHILLKYTTRGIPTGKTWPLIKWTFVGIVGSFALYSVIYLVIVLIFG